MVPHMQQSNFIFIRPQRRSHFLHNELKYYMRNCLSVRKKWSRETNLAIKYSTVPKSTEYKETEKHKIDAWSQNWRKKTRKHWVDVEGKEENEKIKMSMAGNLL